MLLLNQLQANEMEAEVKGDSLLDTNRAAHAFEYYKQKNYVAARNTMSKMKSIESTYFKEAGMFLETKLILYPQPVWGRHQDNVLLQAFGIHFFNPCPDSLVKKFPELQKDLILNWFGHSKY